MENRSKRQYDRSRDYTLYFALAGLIGLVILKFAVLGKRSDSVSTFMIAVIAIVVIVIPVWFGQVRADRKMTRQLREIDDFPVAMSIWISADSLPAMQVHSSDKLKKTKRYGLTYGDGVLTLWRRGKDRKLTQIVSYPAHWIEDFNIYALADINNRRYAGLGIETMTREPLVVAPRHGLFPRRRDVLRLADELDAALEAEGWVQENHPAHKHEHPPQPHQLTPAGAPLAGPPLPPPPPPFAPQAPASPPAPISHRPPPPPPPTRQ